MSNVLVRSELGMPLETSLEKRLKADPLYEVSKVVQGILSAASESPRYGIGKVSSAAKVGPGLYARFNDFPILTTKCVRYERMLRYSRPIYGASVPVFRSGIFAYELGTEPFEAHDISPEPESRTLFLIEPPLHIKDEEYGESLHKGRIIVPGFSEDLNSDPPVTVPGSLEDMSRCDQPRPDSAEDLRRLRWTAPAEGYLYYVGHPLADDGELFEKYLKLSQELCEALLTQRNTMAV